jgi:hypothetical protein
MEVLSDEDKEVIRKSVADDTVHRALLAIKERHGLRVTSDILEVTGKLLAGITTVLTFTSSSFFERNTTICSFCAGIIGTIGVAVTGWSYYFDMESKERQDRLNVILLEAGLRLEEEPDAVETSIEHNNNE